MKILKLWNVKFIMNQKCVEGKEPMKFMWQFQLSIFLSVVEPFKIFNLGNINNLLTHGYWLQTLWYIQRQFTSGATVWMIIWFTKERGWVNKSCCVHWTSQRNESANPIKIYATNLLCHLFKSFWANLIKCRSELNPFPASLVKGVTALFDQTHAFGELFNL